MNPLPKHPATSRRAFLGAGAGLVALGYNASAGQERQGSPGSTQRPKAGPVLVGSANALAGMKIYYEALLNGAAPLDVVIDVVKLAEANADDHSVGLGGMPNQNGVVQLDAACMDGRTHNAGSVGCLENILHPSEVARLVMERTDHCMLVGRGAYDFARMHGHPHTELLTDSARAAWLRWMESMSDKDDRLPPAAKTKDVKHGGRDASVADEPQVAGAEFATGGVGAEGEMEERITGTIHCSGLAVDGHVACTTTTSGLSWKIPGRVGDSPIIGAGLYCDGEAGSAGATGRGEAAILSHGASAIVELLRQGATPLEAGMELMARVTRQAQRASAWQPGLVDEKGVPSFNLSYYVLGLDGTFAGVRLKGTSRFAVADRENGPRIETMPGFH